MSNYNDIFLGMSHYYDLRSEADRYRLAKQYTVKPEKHPTKKTPLYVFTKKRRNAPCFSYGDIRCHAPDEKCFAISSNIG